MVLFIGGIINAMFLPETFASLISEKSVYYNRKSIMTRKIAIRIVNG
jgi:hypothetical protein